MTAFRMNLRWLLAGSLLAAGLSASLAQGQNPKEPQNPPQSLRRTLEIQRLRFKLYERVEYPLRQRQLQSEITLLEAQVASLGRRIKEVDGFYGSTALFTMREDLRLDLLATELLLKDRRHELTLLQTHNQDERRLRQLLIAETQQQISTGQTR